MHSQLNRDQVDPGRLPTHPLSKNTQPLPHPACLSITRHARKFYNAPGETAWFRTSSQTQLEAPFPASSLIGLCDGDLFINHYGNPPSHQIWHYTDGEWVPIDIGYQILDPSGRARQLVVHGDGEVSWVLRVTAQKNYNPARKPRASKVCRSRP